ncbi:MAG: DEAD/DEAH box helicase [Pseudomonadota bacterium]
MSQKILSNTRFDEMNLSPAVFAALQDVGYETPTPIQSLTIPHIMENKDLLGQARTGTGKTAAFALPLLSRIDLENNRPQVLVLTPTRELAIQVAESFKTYGSKMKGLNVLSVYGGQSYEVQLKQLKRGVHVVVGTPGRLMDHMRRKTVTFADLFCVVLDEADEMLHMGFIEDVEWILEKTPDEAQIALFSATMPAPIRKIAGKYLKNPEEILVQPDTDVLSTIHQQFWVYDGTKKTEALIRILEATTYDGVIVFAKTRTATVEITKVLEERGLKAEALNGEIAQAARERTINRLKNGQIDILVATDVAARGLDVDRISHVINYDMPPKIEPYIHRIGRTGRAGRTGEAILFVGRNERWMLKNIERATRQTIKEIFLPSNQDINKKRVADFKQSITQAMASEDLDFFTDLVQTYAEEQDVPVVQVAAAIAKLTHGNKPFLLPPSKGRAKAKVTAREKSSVTTLETIREKAAKPKTVRKPVDSKKNLSIKEKPVKKEKKIAAKSAAPMDDAPIKEGMERYRIEVGQKHGLQPGDVVGAISNEAGLEGRFIGSIRINQDYSFVDLPFGMPNNIFHLLKQTWVKSRRMSISKCA